MIQKYICLSCVVLSMSTAALAAIRPSQRHEAGGNKAGNYISEGFYVGGDRSVSQVKLKDIRRAKSNEGFERIVFDLEPQTEDPDSIPYFQIQASPNEGRFVLSIWSNVQYDFDPARVSKAFSKSSNVKRLNVLPRVEEGLAVIELMLNQPKSGKAKEVKFEAFRLARPARIIMDIL